MKSLLQTMFQHPDHFRHLWDHPNQHYLFKQFQIRIVLFGYLEESSKTFLIFQASITYLTFYDSDAEYSVSP